MVDSEGVSNLNPQAPTSDPLGLTLPALGGIATAIQKLVDEGLSIDEMAQKVAVWVDPSLVPALQTLASVLQAIKKFV